MRKGHALSVVSEPGFWEREDRFAILAEAEYLDRLAAAAATAERLGARLRRSPRPGGDANAELVELLANRLYVLDRAVAGIAAGAPTDVCVHLRASGTDQRRRGGALRRAPRGDVRGLGGKAGHAPRAPRRPRRRAPARVSGLGCGEILGGEAGLHVLEHVDGSGHDGDRIVDREHVRVQVVALAPGPAAGSAESPAGRSRPPTRPMRRPTSSGAIGRAGAARPRRRAGLPDRAASTASSPVTSTSSEREAEMSGMTVGGGGWGG